MLYEIYPQAVAGSEAGGHRALVFAQSRALLDLVEADVLRPLGVPSVRLDGSVDAAQRFRVVKEFNEDPSVPVVRGSLAQPWPAHWGVGCEVPGCHPRRCS